MSCTSGFVDDATFPDEFIATVPAAESAMHRCRGADLLAG